MSLLNIKNELIFVVKIMFFTNAVVSLNNFLGSCKVIGSFSLYIRVRIMDNVLNDIKGDIFCIFLSNLVSALWLLLCDWLCINFLVFNLLYSSFSLFLSDFFHIHSAIDYIYNSILINVIM